jgi:Hsp70 protein
MEPILVVDVGTATTMARVVADGVDQFVKDPQPLVSGAEHWPTSVAHDRRGGFHVGAVAAGQGTTQGLVDGRFMRNFDQPGAEVPLDGTRYAPEQLLAALLIEIRNRAWALPQADVEFDRILLTIPDGDDPAVNRRLLRAARLARFRDVELLPTSAAVALKSPAEQPTRSQLLICDAGASGLRFTLVRPGRADGTDPGRVESTRTIAGLGGDSMDAALARNIREKLLGKQNRWPLAAKSRRQTTDAVLEWDAYLEPARLLRRRLSSEDGRVKPQLATLDLVDFSYSQDDLQRLLAEPLRELKAECERYRRSSADIGDVVLVGGCARMPFLADVLRKGLRRDVRLAGDPDFATVVGAAAWARLASGRVIRAMPRRPGARDLAWQFKDGGARLIGWQVPEGGSFSEGDRLATVRGLGDHDDRVFYLTADCSGTMQRHRVGPGTAADSGDVLAIVEVRPTKLEEMCRPYSICVRPDETGLSFSADGRYLAVRGAAGGRSVLDLETCAATSWPLDAVFREPGISSDGTRMCRLEGSDVIVRETRAKGPKLHTVSSPDFYGEPFASFALSRDGRVLVHARRDTRREMRGLKVPQRRLTGGTLVVTRIPSGKDEKPRELPGLPALDQPPLRLALSRNGGRLLLVVDVDATMTDVANGQQLWKSPDSLGPVHAVAFSHYDDLFLTVHQAREQWSGVVWESGGLARLYLFDLRRPTTWALFSPDNRYLVTGDDAHSAIWGLVP